MLKITVYSSLSKTPEYYFYQDSEADLAMRFLLINSTAWHCQIEQVEDFYDPEWE